MSRILDKSFVYTPSAATDIRKRFAKIDPHWNKKPSRKPVPQNVRQMKRKSA